MSYIKSSLNRQILLITAGVVLVIQTVFGVHTYFSLKSKEYAQLDAGIAAYMEDTLLTIRDPVYNFDKETVRQLIDIHLSGNDFLVGAIVYQEGAQEPMTGRTRTWDGKAGDLPNVPYGEFYLVKEREIVKEGQKIGRTVFIFTDRKVRETVKETMFKTIFAIAILELALVAAIYISLDRIITQPIREITGEIRNSASVPAGSDEAARTETLLKLRGDEIGEMHRAMDDLFSRRTREISEAYSAAKAAKDSLETEMAERKQAQIELKKSEERLQSILDNATAVIFLKDISGRYLLINKRYEELFNISRDRISGKTDHDIFPPEAADSFRKNDLAVLKANRPLEMEEVVPQADGTHVYLSIKFPLYDQGGTPYAVCGIATDITERKQAEVELKAAKAEAEEATKIKDKFISLVSHDLKNPIHVVRGYLEIIMGSEVENKKLIQDMSREAISSLDDMTKFINDILNVSRISGGRMVPRYSFFDASGTAGRVVDAFLPSAEKKGIRLSNELPAGSRIYADEKLFHEVMANLVSNAIKFCNNGNSIRIFSPQGMKSAIAIEDTGVGIDPRRIDSLFKYEEKKSTRGTAGESGTGFGLPLCRDIMLAHDGELKLESQLGKGTRFIALFPDVRPRVLIVDDDPREWEMVRRVIAPLDADYIEAVSGEDALDKMKGALPHLVITDVFMPGMDGFGLIERLKSNQETRHIPIIVMTSSDDNMTARNRVFQLGADDFVSKSLSMNELLPRVKRYIG